ncbi:MAG TPA: NAD-dependent epimerase/dehydratase family protein, partial [Acidimicrobiales bacterium]|nr:NAD-dependent epimerase/dehydratase family protein [Acidimicrobiales bacterium]
MTDAGHDVVVLDRRAPDFCNDRATYLLGDVRDDGVWRRALEGVGAVSHQAARVGLGRDFGDVTDYVDDNDVGTAM